MLAIRTVDEAKGALTEWVDTFFEGCDVDIASFMKENNIRTADLLLIAATESESPGAMAQLPVEMKGVFVFEMMFNRMKHLNLPLTEGAFVLIAQVCRTPGEVVMYLTAIKHTYAAVNVEGEPCDLNTLIGMFGHMQHTAMSWAVQKTTPSIFFPSRQHLHKMWDAQKIDSSVFRSDNLLDLPTDENWFFDMNIGVEEPIPT